MESKTEAISNATAKCIICLLVVYVVTSSLFNKTETYTDGFLKPEMFIRSGKAIHIFSFLESDNGLRKIMYGASPVRGTKYESRVLTYQDCDYNVDETILKNEYEHHQFIVKKVNEEYVLYIRGNGKLNKVYVMDTDALTLTKEMELKVELIPDKKIGKGGYLIRHKGKYLTVSDDQIMRINGDESIAMVVYFGYIEDLKVLNKTKFCTV